MNTLELFSIRGENRMKERIDARVHKYYWEDDFNCAATVLKTAAEIFHVDIQPQVIEAATGMHGAGKYGAQCGLVEGSLMFIGIYGSAKAIGNEKIIALCHDFAGRFEQRFGSLRCKELRPQGFRPNDPPHLCEGKTKIAVNFFVEFIQQEVNESLTKPTI